MYKPIQEGSPAKIKLAGFCIPLHLDELSKGRRTVKSPVIVFGDKRDWVAPSGLSILLSICYCINREGICISTCGPSIFLSFFSPPNLIFFMLITMLSFSFCYQRLIANSIQFMSTSEKTSFLARVGFE